MSTIFFQTSVCQNFFVNHSINCYWYQHVQTCLKVIFITDIDENDNTHDSDNVDWNFCLLLSFYVWTYFYDFLSCTKIWQLSLWSIMD